MEHLDSRSEPDLYEDDEDMLLREVIRDEHDLLFLDSYLKESLRMNDTL